MAALAFANALLCAQVNPDACKQVRQDDVATLISLNQSTVVARDNSDRPSQCDWEVKTPVSVMGGQVRLTLEQFDTHEQAVASMRQEAPYTFDKDPVLVKTAGPDDHLRESMTDSMAYAHAEAVHGDYLAKVDVEQFEPAARAHPTFRYRLQRLALQAAGATILPTVGLPPDPVPPRPQPQGTAAPQTVEHSTAFYVGMLLFVLFDSVIVFVLFRRIFRKNA